MTAEFFSCIFWFVASRGQSNGHSSGYSGNQLSEVAVVPRRPWGAFGCIPNFLGWWTEFLLEWCTQFWLNSTNNRLFPRKIQLKIARIISGASGKNGFVRSSKKRKWNIFLNIKFLINGCFLSLVLNEWSIVLKMFIIIYHYVKNFPQKFNYAFTSINYFNVKSRNEIKLPLYVCNVNITSVFQKMILNWAIKYSTPSFMTNLIYILLTPTLPNITSHLTIFYNIRI